MQIDLFSLALLLCLSFLTFVSLSFGFQKNTYIHHHLSHHRKSLQHRWLWTHVGIIVFAGISLALVCRYGVTRAFPQDDIPWEMVAWALPLGIAVTLLAYNIRQLWGALISCGAIILSLVLFLLLANNYWHYYPTVSALFEHSQNQTQVTVSTEETTRNVVLEQFYQPLVHQPTKGEFQTLTIPASTHFSPRQGRIYLPPALHSNDLIRLPVIVLLAGYPGDPAHWEQAGLESIMNNFAAKHRGLAPIVAVVDFTGVSDPDTECVDSKLGMSETYLTKDVPAYLKKHFQVSPDVTDWTIAGYSAGGTCSTLIALRNPSVYRNYMNISGDTYPSLKTPSETLATLFAGSEQARDEHTPNLLLEKGNPLYDTMNAWYYIGQQDNPNMIKRGDEQAALAAKKGLTVKRSVVVGHHGFLVWKQGFIDGLPWMMNKERLTTSER